MLRSSAAVSFSRYLPRDFPPVISLRKVALLIRVGWIASPSLAIAPMKTIMAHGLTRSSACPIPAQLSFMLSSAGKSNDPAAVLIPLTSTGSVRPAFSVYSCKVLAPSSLASSPNAPLQDCARADLKFTSPCERTSVNSVPLYSFSPSQSNL